VIGNIYLAKIYFTDLSDYKLRPVLVIKQLADDFLCLPLTSQLKSNALALKQEDFLSGNLKQASFVIAHKSFTLHKSILSKHLATLKPDILLQAVQMFCLYLGCH